MSHYSVKVFPIKQKRSARMHTGAYKEDVAIATALGTRVHKRALCSVIGNLFIVKKSIEKHFKLNYAFFRISLNMNKVGEINEK